MMSEQGEGMRDAGWFDQKAHVGRELTVKVGGINIPKYCGSHIQMDPSAVSGLGPLRPGGAHRRRQGRGRRPTSAGLHATRW